ncbi:MAG: polyprenyl synthetase family protein [Phycisphaerales bacterium]|nr:polyprenyl synthetase family protein [Phycisphaerales bacterium]
MLQTAPEHIQIAKVVHHELEKVERIFCEQLASDLPVVNDLCHHVERYRGKMLRPSMVLLTGLAVSGEPCDGSALLPEHLTVATVVEMIHMATLVHDDVLDEASVRRRGATVNTLRGNETAVMLGDYLISNAFHLCSRAGDPLLNEMLGQVTNTLCEGELVQLSHRDDLSLDQATYIEIVRRKTAALVGVSCRLGARFSGADDALQDAMDRFGSSLGIAFQIQDDLLDLAGDPDVVGKSIGRDLATGKMTLPVILHLASEVGHARGETLRLIEARDADGLRRRLIEDGAVDRARAHAEELVSEAKLELERLPMSSARDLLGTLADAVISREA